MAHSRRRRGCGRCLRFFHFDTIYSSPLLGGTPIPPGERIDHILVGAGTGGVLDGAIPEIQGGSNFDPFRSGRTFGPHALREYGGVKGPDTLRAPLSTREALEVITVAAIEMAVPKDLKSRMPSGLMTATRHRFAVNLFCFSLGCLALSTSENRNGWTYFLGAVLAPAIAAGYFIIKPFNPYRTPAAKFAGMTNMDEQDPQSRRLSLLMGSAAARNLLIKSFLKLSALFLLAMVAIAYVQSRKFSWAFDGDDVTWFVLLTLTSCALTVPIYVNSLLIWSIQNWRSTPTRE